MTAGRGLENGYGVSRIVSAGVHSDGINAICTRNDDQIGRGHKNKTHTKNRPWACTEKTATSRCESVSVDLPAYTRVMSFVVVAAAVMCARAHGFESVSRMAADERLRHARPRCSNRENE